MNPRFQNGNDSVQPEKKAAAPKVVSVLALVSGGLALVCGIIAPVLLSPSGSIHMTNQAFLDVSGFILLTMSAMTFSVIGLILGIIGGITALIRRPGIIWMAVLAVIFSAAAGIAAFMGLPA